MYFALLMQNLDYSNRASTNIKFFAPLLTEKIIKALSTIFS